MTKNPFLNALIAILYIVLVATIMFYGSKVVGGVNSIIVPIAMISLFTLSAAVMGYLFLFEPTELYFNNKKKEAIKLFLKTVIFFAIITVIIFTILFSISKIY